jgi:hypothetical protein
MHTTPASATAVTTLPAVATITAITAVATVIAIIIANVFPSFVKTIHIF